MTLRIARGLALPLDYATKTAAILAQRRKGKTYAASVIAEEMVAAKQPFVALDPTGAWWGLRSSADGQSAGLPVVILGGQHGDLPLERTGGKLVADLVVEEPGYYVIDFSLFESGEAERQFAVDFAERLYRAKGQAGRDFPLHLFVDEADRFIPQQIRKGNNETSARLLGAFEAIVRRGGLRGLGTTLISQRAAVVNKNVLEMLDILIVLRTLGPNDRDAIDSYVKAHGTGEERSALLASLASIAIGEAWIWEPGAEPPLFQRVQIRERRTFNSSATPKAGERRSEPRRLADVDMEKYRSRMAETIERAKADDPKALRAQIRDLERLIDATRASMVPDPAVMTEARRMAYAEGLDQGARVAQQQVANFVARTSARSERAAHAIDEALGHLKAAADSLREVIDVPEISVGGAEAKPDARYQGAGRMGSQGQSRQSFGTSPRQSGTTLPRSGSQAHPIPTDGFLLAKGERSCLIAIAQSMDGATREYVTIMTGYKRSTRDAYIQRLRVAGLIEDRGHLFATQTGVDALGDDYEPLPTGAVLRDWWLQQLPEGERACLAELISAYPKAVSRDDVSESTGYKRSTRDAYLQRLRTRRLVDDQERGMVRASELLFTVTR